MYAEFNFITVSGVRSYHVSTNIYCTSPQLAGELLGMDVIKGTVLMSRKERL
jgi:hypothetical protein